MLVFGQGFGLDQSSWRHVAPAFEADHRVVMFDYVGSGHSDRTAYDRSRYATLDGCAQDLLDVLEAVRCESCVFVGASISGMIGLLAVRRAPQRFERLITIGSSACYTNFPESDYHGGFSPADIEGLLDMLDQNFVGWAANLASTAIKDPDIAVELEQGICAIDPRIARQFADITFHCDFRPLLPEHKLPTLVIQCEHDDVVPTAAAEYLALHLPNSQYRVLPATSHCPHLTHPDELRAVITAYLQSHVER
jgi:sigma-B regulation protein RsbQ